MDLLSFGFMQRALVVGIALAVTLPGIGLIVVLRRQSMIGDALAHNSLAGVACGLLIGINPLVGAAALSLFSAFSIEYFRKKLGRYSEMAIAIVLSAGIGLASILSDFVSGANFNSFLFGSIVAVTPTEMYITLGVSIAVLILFEVLKPALFLMAYSPQQARLTGVRVRLTETLFTIMTAAMISIASRTVGALMVSSFLVIPVACAMALAKSFRATRIWAIGLSLAFILVGLFLSARLNLKPGGTFVMLSLITFALITAGKKLFRHKL